MERWFNPGHGSGYDENTSRLGTQDNRGLGAAASFSPLVEDEVDLSDDEDQARREFEAVQAP